MLSLTDNWSLPTHLLYVVSGPAKIVSAVVVMDMTAINAIRNFNVTIITTIEITIGGENSKRKDIK